MYDTLIRNGTVFDGSQKEPVRADVAIKDGHIVAVAPALSPEAGQVIDATGKYVTPGFIDPHSHSDLSLLIEPDGDSKLRQGVTTEVVGNCGDSPAPAYGQWARELDHSRFGPAGVRVTWTTFGEYLAHLAELKPIVNVAPLVGHGAIRASVLGIEDRAPTLEEMAQMKKLTREAMAEGAWGMSTGLIYPPGTYSKTDELVELAREVGQAGGFYASHVRGEAATVLKAIGEATEVGLRARLPVQVSHVKVCAYRNFGMIDDLISLVESTQNLELPVFFDQYPYSASATSLISVLPEWTYVGGMEAAARRLADPAARERLRLMVKESPGDFWDYAGTRDWDGVLITACPSREEVQGQTVAEVGRSLGTDPLEALLDLLVETGCVADCVMFDQDESNTRRVMQLDRVMVGSDGYSVKASGYAGKRAMHPRSYGTFPRVLGHYGRDEKLLSWPRAVHKMTGLPAQALGLTDRGVLRPGAWADVVILDPVTVIDQATFTDAHQYPLGIEYVWVNGQPAVAHSETTGMRAGAVLPPPR
jgi:N-acyl-D-amino-acid deacylase